MNWIAMLIVLILSAPVAAVELHDTVAALRAEPLTLFDWGIYQLEDELQSVRRHKKDFIRAYYDPVAKQLNVEGVFLVEQDEVDAINPQMTCFVRHHAIKLTLGIIDTNRIHVAPEAEFRLGMKFSHHNSDAFAGLPDAADLGARLMKSVHIKVGITTNIDQFPFAQIQRCDGALLSQEVDYHSPRSDEVLPTN